LCTLEIHEKYEGYQSMKIGYARVSTNDQSLSLQKDALIKAGCYRIYDDVVSGATTKRIGLQGAFNELRENDVLVVWKLDRLGRSLKQLIEMIQYLNSNRIGFQSLQENIDTTTTGGKLVFHIFSALAEFERDLIRDRTKAGLNAARKRGVEGGRPALLTQKQIKKMMAYYNKRKLTVTEICKLFNIGRSCFYNYLRKQKRLNNE